MKTRVIYVSKDAPVIAFPQDSRFDENQDWTPIIPNVCDEVELGDNQNYIVERAKHFPPTDNSANLESAFKFVQSISNKVDEHDVNPNAGWRCREDFHIVVIVLKETKA